MSPKVSPLATDDADRSPATDRDLAAMVQGAVAALDRSQWHARSEIEASQRRQLGALAHHSAEASPFFAARLRAARLTAADLAVPGGLDSLPVLSRQDIQRAGVDLFCQSVPARHGEVTEGTTSGSTGEPITVRYTRVSYLIWLAMTMRDHRWHGRSFEGRLCAIRGTASAPERLADWGPPTSLLARTGPSLLLPIAADPSALVQSVLEFGSTDLLIYPDTLAAIIDYCADRGITLPVRQVRTVGETLSAAVRRRAEDAWQGSVVDCYSSREVGYIALQCPHSGRYHAMSESLIAEVLDEQGKPCLPGGIGRVTITDLHNHATPLIRYDIGDYAEVAEPCPCGRQLPTWSRIVGRERNHIRMPDGRSFWPVIGYIPWREIAPVRQYQFVQTSVETIDVRLVVDRPLTSSEEAQVTRCVHQSVGHPFDLTFVYLQRIPRSRSGKFEQFICQVPREP